MSSPHRAPLSALLLAAALAPGPRSLAEVSAVPDGTGGVAATIQILDREPTPWRIWSPVRLGAEPALLLNPEGDLYGDGPPSIVFNRTTGLPEAVWAYWDGSDYEIAWSRFEGGSWSMAQTPHGPDFHFLTSDTLQDLDPRIWIDQAGNRRVVWWRSGPGLVDEVVVAVLPAGETQWWLPQRVSTLGVPTRRPDVRTFSAYGTFIVAEEEGEETISVTVFNSPSLKGHTPQRDSEPWGRRRVRTLTSTASLEPSIGARAVSDDEVPFLSWREGSSLAISVYDTEALTWSAPYFVPYPVW